MRIEFDDIKFTFVPSRISS